MMKVSAELVNSGEVAECALFVDFDTFIYYHKEGGETPKEKSLIVCLETQEQFFTIRDGFPMDFVACVHCDAEFISEAIQHFEFVFVGGVYIDPDDECDTLKSMLYFLPCCSSKVGIILSLFPNDTETLAIILSISKTESFQFDDFKELCRKYNFFINVENDRSDIKRVIQGYVPEIRGCVKILVKNQSFGPVVNYM